MSKDEVRSVKKCKTSREFIQAVRSQGGHVRQLYDRYVALYPPEGEEFVELRDSSDLGRGEIFSVKSGLLLLGFVVFLCAFLGAQVYL